MKLNLRNKILAVGTALGVSGFVSAETATWQETINTTIAWLNSILPLFGDLITNLGNYLMWPLIYLGIIVSIGVAVMVIVGIPATLIAGAVVMVVRKFGFIGGSRTHRY